MAAMTASAPIPPGEYVPTADQRAFLHGVSWDDFELLLRIRGDRRPLMAYLDGVVEIMSPSGGHEVRKSFIGHLIEHYCLERDITLTPVGALLHKNKRKKVAAEPDESYIFGPYRSRRQADLVIEVVWTSGGIDKLEIYQKLGVDEVWFWEDGALTVYGLGTSGYAVRERSRWLPDLDLAIVARCAEAESLNDAVNKFRAATKR